MLIEGLTLIVVSVTSLILIRKVSRTMSKIDELQEAVSAQGSVIESAETLLENLSQQLQDAIDGDDDTDEAVQSIIDSINTQRESLAAAIVANTPSATGGAEPTPGEGEDDTEA